MNKRKFVLLLVLIVALISVGSSSLFAAAPEVVAFDMVGSASQNLTSFVDDPAVPFTSAGDGFGKYQRGVSASIPFSVLDDSLSIFPGDSLGIIGEGNTDEFFGATDTVNGDTSGPVTAVWTFDVSGYENLELAIDMGAMGDFEASDTMVWEAVIDGGPAETVFVNSVDEAGSQVYILEGGASFTLNDPMLVNGVLLNNNLQTVTNAISGSGNELVLSLTVSTDGGSEAMAFQNIVISGTLIGGPQVVAFDMVGSASQNLTSFVDDPAVPFTSAGDGFGKYQRGLSTSIPFSVLDDSLSIFPTDSLGIIGESNTDEFFGATDTVNPDTIGPVTAVWTFDVSGFDNLELSIDMGAMGDFEASDTMVWEAVIDGGPAETVFVNSVDEAGSQSYTLEGGGVFTLNDPMLVDGVLLNNVLQTLTKPISGSGNELVLSLTVSTDGGSEAMVFQNLSISGTPIAGPQVVAFDMVGSASQNLTSYVNNAPVPFTSAGDGFGKYQRGVSASIPFSVMDDSLSIFPTDSLGIIDENNVDEFFGATDTINGDNPIGPVTAVWTFDVSGFDNLELSIDMGAMGDFETSDYFSWEASIDGGAAETLFASTVDEAGSQDYTLSGGGVFTLSDPMLVDGVLLNNVLQTFTKSVSGSGNELTLTLTLETNGGTEAMAFQNISISSVPPGADLVPTVVSTAPFDGEEDVPFDANIVVAFSEDVTLSGTWLEASCSVSGTVAGSLSGSGNVGTFTPASDFAAGETCSVTVFANNVTDLDGTPDNMAQDYSWTFKVFKPFVCGDPATLIHDIQGSGVATGMSGMEVDIEGIVVGDFQAGDGDATDLAGFYLQEEDLQADGDPLTSEGIFVFDLGSVIDVAVGDLVRVRGIAGEFQDQTQIGATNGQVAICNDNPGNLTSVTTILFPLPNGQADLEQYEGMLVDVAEPMTVIEYFNLARYGIVDVATERLEQPTDAADPGPASDAVLDYNNARRIRLDDGNQTQNPFPVTLPDGQLDYADALGGGDTLSDIVGVLSWIRPRVGGNPEGYAIQLTQLPTFDDTNPRPANPPAVGGEIKVVGFNVLNFFNGDGVGGGFPTPRGATNLAELQKQTDKIVAALSAIDADVLGLIEIENDFADGANSAVAELVDALNAATAPGTYGYVDPGANVGTDAITVAIVYKVATVTPVGNLGVLDSQAFVNPFNASTAKNRPALAQTFADADGGKLTVVVNHLKSKGSGCDTDTHTNDDDPRAGSCNLTRSVAAQVLVDWLAADPTGSGDDDFLLIGDYNAYAQEDPINVFVNAGYVDLFALLQPAEVYSYVFNGQTGYLDYGIASASLVAQVTGAAPWNINSDEPNAFEYDENFDNPANLPLWYAPTAYASSDHDPVFVGLDVNAPPVCDFAAASSDVLWPANHKMVEIDVLGVTDPDAGDSVTIMIDSIFQDEPVDGNGSGNTAPDGDGLGTATALVRAERDGGGNGRYYHISFTATDTLGLSCSGVVLVSVPKSQGNNGAAVDDGALYNSTLVP